ncbi:pyridoxal phosphate-dependent aminotransferase [Enterococcus sp. 669A]|uniref:cysteine-S-conjugate beta-lyase n=1 Tax=Candidatus Enterococcus moelleringii TaxID=2815325 RepID=A0ABS3L6Q8_9ENTE|nr:MalY/PatB family protein [Enterococcus sp. 669A]MBO1305308.1 pyridoxal phosphate-dependent aminotransferase [Enterococcus sp. 669A]
MVNFDEQLDRKGTNSVKWDEICLKYQEEDLLPLWVADMDFKAPSGVINAYQEMISHGIFGYSATPDSLYEAIIAWEQDHHQLGVTKDNILFFSGVLAGIATAVQAFTEPSDAVLIHDPVYPPFAGILTENKRKIVRSRLLEKDGRFIMDFADMEEKIKQNHVKMVILCNPHNPGGRVWTEEELNQFGELCRKYGILVLSDEIHQDLVFSPNKMTSFFNAGENFADFTVQFTSMTKTFNLAGIKNSVAFAKNPKLHQLLERKQAENFQQEINTFGLVGMEAAYRTGEEWLNELLVYLQKNIETTFTFFEEHLPKAKIMKPEGTYLLWIDFSAYGLTDEELENRLVHEGKVVLNTGISYGPGGQQHMRLNVACSNATLLEGLNRIARVLN